MRRPRPSAVPSDLDIPQELRRFLDDLDRKIPRGNNSATGAPTVNDDEEAGYDVRGRWFDLTNGAEYVCLDATAGAALWKKTTP